MSIYRKGASGGIDNVYSYAYDDGDNMLEKVDAFHDDFDDGDIVGWTTNGAWTGTNGYVVNTVNPSGKVHILSARVVRLYLTCLSVTLGFRADRRDGPWSLIWRLRRVRSDAG